MDEWLTSLMKRFNTLAAVTATAVLAVGCADPEKSTYEPMRMPTGTTDLGEGSATLGHYWYEAHSFLVASKKVGEATCGAVIQSDGRRHNSNRKLTPAGDSETQVDCIYPDQDNAYLTDGEINKLRSMPVEYSTDK
jgi:hypothetical protein